MATYSTDVDASGTLLTTEWGNPPQLQPAGVPNYQGYGATGQGVEEVYKYLYDPTDNVPPQDEAEGGLALQEQEWVQEVVYLEDVDPEFIEGGDIGPEVVFENPLDTVDENATIASDETFTVFTDGDASGPDESNIEVDIGDEPAQDELVEDAVTETPSDAPQEGSEATEAETAPVVAPETSEAPVATTYRPATEQE